MLLYIFYYYPQSLTLFHGSAPFFSLHCKQQSSSSSDSGSSKSDASDVDWDASSSSSSSSESEKEDAPKLGTGSKRNFWLKKTVVKKTGDKTKGVKIPKNLGEEKKEMTAAVNVEKKEEVEEEMTAAVLNRKCLDLVSSRGRRGTDTKAVLQKLEKLSTLAEKFGPRIEVPILMHVITAQFDLIRTLDDYMETPSWRATMGHLERIAGILEDGEDETKKFQLCTASIEEDDLMIGNVLAKKKDNKMKDASGVGEMGALEAVAADKQLINPHTGETETEDERAERLRVEKEANMTEEELRRIPAAGENLMN